MVLAKYLNMHDTLVLLCMVLSTLSETETEIRAQSIFTLQFEPYISISNKLVTSLGAVKACMGTSY